MAEILLFHHAAGLTPGVLAFADDLRAQGHTVHTPDLFDGEVFTNLEDGMAKVEQLGMGEIINRGMGAAQQLPTDLVYIGFSVGVLPAQLAAQTRPGARGAVLLHSCVPASEFGSWPAGVPVQVHAMENDPFFSTEGDAEAARDLVASADDAELFLYPGDEHLFADRSLPSYDKGAADLLMERVQAFLKARS